MIYVDYYRVHTVVDADATLKTSVSQPASQPVSQPVSQSLICGLPSSLHSVYLIVPCNRSRWLLLYYFQLFIHNYRTSFAIYVTLDLHM
jgi:hypothetical protein